MIFLNRLPDFPDDDWIIIDTNILLYWAFKHPLYYSACEELLHRSINQKMHLCLPPMVRHEFLHRLMIAEVIEDGNANSHQQALNLIKRDPSIIQKLTRTFEIYDAILSCEMIMLEDNADVFSLQMDNIKKYGLMAADAAIVASASYNQIFHIATNDSDYERISWLTVWKP